MLRKHFDLLHISHSTVPLYADECGMLVFGALLTASQRDKKCVFITLKAGIRRMPAFLLSESEIIPPDMLVDNTFRPW